MDVQTLEQLRDSYEDICRLCRVHLEIKIPLTKQEDGLTIGEIHEQLTGIKQANTTFSRTLPSNICPLCYSQIVAFVKFRKQCVETNNSFAMDWRNLQQKKAEQEISLTFGLDFRRLSGTSQSSSIEPPQPTLVLKNEITSSPVASVTLTLPAMVGTEHTPMLLNAYDVVEPLSPASTTVPRSPSPQAINDSDDENAGEILPGTQSPPKKTSYATVSPFVEIPAELFDSMQQKLEDSLECQYCKRIFESQFEKYSHTAKAHNMTNVSCFLCEETCQSYQFFANHLATVHRVPVTNEKPLIPSEVETRNRRRTSSSSAEKNVKKVKDTHCATCDRDFVSHKGLALHISKTHYIRGK